MIIHCWFSRWANDQVPTIRVQMIKWPQGARDSWSMVLKLYSLLPGQFQELMGQETGKQTNEHLTLELVLPAEFWGFYHRSIYTTPSLLTINGVHLFQRRNLSSGFTRDHWESFKLDLKVYVDIAGLDRDKMSERRTTATSQVAKGGLRGNISSKHKQPNSNCWTGLWVLPLYPQWDIDTVKYFYKVPAHQWMQCGEQTGGTCYLCAKGFDVTAVMETWCNRSPHMTGML